MDLVTIMTNFNDKLPPENVLLLIADYDEDMNIVFKLGYFCMAGNELISMAPHDNNPYCKPNIVPLTAYYMFDGYEDGIERWHACRTVMDTMYLVLEERKGS